MKLTVFHHDPDILARMAQRLAQEFHPSLMLLDPEEPGEAHLDAGRVNRGKAAPLDGNLAAVPSGHVVPEGGTDE